MSHLLPLFVAIIAVIRTIAITTKQAIPGTQVRFHYTNKSKRAQTNKKLIRKAEALNGKKAVIMKIPLWKNEKRVQIRSLDNPHLILGVKPYYLELTSLLEGETHIHLFISRTGPNTSFSDHIMSERYYREELSTANDARYRAVIVNNPRTALQSRTAPKSQSLVRFNRFPTGAHRQYLPLVLLNEVGEFLGDSRIFFHRKQGEVRNLLMRCLQHIWDSEHARDRLLLSILESELMISIFSTRFLEAVHLEYMAMSTNASIILHAESTIFDESACFAFTLVLIRSGLVTMSDHTEERMDVLIPKLNQQAAEFYEKQRNVLQKLFLSNNSEIVLTFREFGAITRRQDTWGGRVPKEAERVVHRIKVMASKITQSLEALEYYLSVGELLTNLRASGEIQGRVAVNCVHSLVSGDWIRAISDIAQCERNCVSMKIM